MTETALTLAPLLLTARAAANALQVSERTLWSLTQPRGPIPAVRLSRRLVRYDPRTLADWIASQARPETAYASENCHAER